MSLMCVLLHLIYNYSTNRLSEMVEDDWYEDVDDFKSHIERIKKKKDEDLAAYLKKHINTAKTQSNTQSWFGLSAKEYKAYMNPSAPMKSPIIHQDSKANQIPTYSTSSQSVTMTQRDFTQFNKFPKQEILYAKLTNKKKSRKFKQLFYLAQGTTESKIPEPDIGVDTGYVPVGETQDDENCVRVLNYFFRSTELSIFRQPYLPDLTLKIADIHGSNLKSEYRVLVLAFAAYVKLNVLINGDDEETRQRLTLNDREKWYDKKNVNNLTLNKLFFDNTRGAAIKHSLLGINNAGQTIMEHLRHDTNINSDNCWFIESLRLVDDPNVNGWDCLTSYFGCWRSKYGQREPHPNNNPDNDWMFGLINNIFKNECLVTIKAIGVVASRIASVLVCDDNECEHDDGLFIVKCVSLILDLFAKGNVNKLAESFSPIVLNSVAMHEHSNINNGFRNLANYSTTICETIRTISNLSRFDFEWVIRSKYVQQNWYSFFAGSLLTLLNNIEHLQKNLGSIISYADQTSNESHFKLEFSRYNNFLTIIFLKFGTVDAPRTASDRADELFKFMKWANHHHPHRVDWSSSELNDYAQTANEWFDDFQQKQHEKRQKQNVYMYDDDVITTDGNGRASRSRSISASRSPTKTNSMTPRCGQDIRPPNDSDHDNDNNNNNGLSSLFNTVSHVISTNNNSNLDINNNSNDNNSDNNNNNTNESQASNMNTDSTGNNEDLNMFDHENNSNNDDTTVMSDKTNVIHDGSQDTNDVNLTENDTQHTNDSEVMINDTSVVINNSNIPNNGTKDNNNSENDKLTDDKSDNNDNTGNANLIENGSNDLMIDNDNDNKTNANDNDNKVSEQTEIHRDFNLRLPNLKSPSPKSTDTKLRSIKRSFNYNSNSFDNLIAQHTANQERELSGNSNQSRTKSVSKSQSRTKSKSVDKARKSISKSNSSKSRKTKKKNRNSNSTSNSDSINIDQYLEDDREESPLEGIEFKEELHESGRVVYNCSTKYIEIRDVRCFVPPARPYNNHPITGIDMAYDKNRANYDFCLQYRPNSILLANGNWGELGHGQQRVFWRGVQQSKRKAVMVRVPKNAKMNEFGECLWEMSTPRGAPEYALNRQFSQLESPRMFVLFVSIK